MLTSSKHIGLAGPWPFLPLELTLKANSLLDSPLDVASLYRHQDLPDDITLFLTQGTEASLMPFQSAIINSPLVFCQQSSCAFCVVAFNKHKKVSKQGGFVIKYKQIKALQL